VAVVASMQRDSSGSAASGLWRVAEVRRREGVVPGERRSERARLHTGPKPRGDMVGFLVREGGAGAGAASGAARQPWDAAGEAERTLPGGGGASRGRAMRS
jgi:hypothetical protein